MDQMPALDELVRQMPGRFFAKDRSSHYVACNQAFAQDAGSSPAAIIGKSDHDLRWADLADAYAAD